MTTRGGGLLSVDGIDSAGQTAALMTHYTNLAIQIVFAQQHQDDPTAPEIGFHTLLDPAPDGRETHPPQL